MPKATTITLSVVDAKGAKSTSKVNVPSTEPIADVIAFGQAYTPLVVALILGLITKASASIPITYAPTGANPLSDVQKRGLFTFHDATGLVAKVVVPTWLESKTQANSDQIDITDTDVAGLINLIVTGDGTIAPVTLRDTGITGLDVARELFRRRTRR